MSEALQPMFENKVDLYWITKGFYKCALEIVRDFNQLKELSYKLLEKEYAAIYKWVWPNDAKYGQYKNAKHHFDFQIFRW